MYAIRLSPGYVLKPAVCALMFLVFTTAVEARSVKVSVPAQSISHVAFYAAKDKGYYREEGLDVELVLMNAAVAVRALIGGDVDFTSVGGSGVPPILRGAPLHFFLLGFHRPIHWLFARPDIYDVKSLKGKKVATSSIGSASDLLLKEVLKRNGLEGGQNLTIIP